MFSSAWMHNLMLHLHNETQHNYGDLYNNIHSTSFAMSNKEHTKLNSVGYKYHSTSILERRNSSLLLFTRSFLVNLSKLPREKCSTSLLPKAFTLWVIEDLTVFFLSPSWMINCVVNWSLGCGRCLVSSHTGAILARMKLFSPGWSCSGQNEAVWPRRQYCIFNLICIKFG